MELFEFLRVLFEIVRRMMIAHCNEDVFLYTFLDDVIQFDYAIIPLGFV